MVELNRIYTKGGDKGKTALGNGKRVLKHDARVAAYGTVDEANAVIGLVRLHCQVDGQGDGEGDGAVDAILSRVQNDLFDLGADLCTPADPPPAYEALRIVEAQVLRLEAEIDRINERLEPLNSFVLPGGSPASAHLHLARTVVRRAEREMTALAEHESINGQALRYMNRLSDLLFVLARHCNAQGQDDVLWIPGDNR